jgi:isopentenyl-diphosphate Delta-isomerase
MKELLEIYLKNGKPTGESEEREIIHEKGIWHKVIHIWVINKKGQLLLQKRSPNKDVW